MMKRMNLKWMSALLFPLLTTNVAAQTADDIEWLNDGDGRYILINETNFPDAAFRNFLLQDNSGTSMGTYGMDGKLMKWELDNVTTLTLSYDGIESLEGIRFFYNLQNLYVDGNQLTVLDLSKNPNIVALNLCENPLEELNLSGCSSLSFNNLTVTSPTETMKVANFTGCTGFTSLALNSRFPNLEELTIAGCTGLSSFSFGSYGGSYDMLKKFDATGCTNLTTLDLVYNSQLEELNLTDCSRLTWNNSLANFQYQAAVNMKVLNLSGCTSMTTMYLNSRFPNLEELTIDRCVLTTFGYTYASGQSNGQLKKFSAADCSTLNSIELTNHFDLEEVYVANCPRLYNFNINSSHYDVLKVLSIQNCPNVGVNSLPYSSMTSLESLTITNHTGFIGFAENTPFTNGKLKTLVLDGCSGFTILNVSGNALETISLNGCTALTNLWVRNNQLSALDLSTNTALINCYARDNQLRSVDVTQCTELQRLELINNLLEEVDVTKNLKLLELYVNTNLLTDLNLDGHTLLEKVNCSENFLDQAEVSHLTKLKSVLASRCGLLNNFHVVNHPDLEILMMNGGHYERTYEKDGEMVTKRRDPSMRIDEIDTQHMTKLRQLLVEQELLTTLDLNNNPNLTFVELTNNRLLTLDMSHITLKDRPEWKQVSDFGSQTSVENVEVVTDGAEQFVGIYLPNGGDAANLSNMKLDGVAVAAADIRTVDGKAYLVLATDKKDIDFYGKTLTYTYDTQVNWDTTYGPTNNQGTTMDVTVTTYPYVMYVNPATRVAGSSEFYSGTLYLDYDAVVPAGVKAYVATGVLDKDKIRLSGEKVSAEDLLDLQLVAEEGQVVPAGTALYIKSETQDGLFAWHKNTETVFDGWYKDFEQSTDSLDVFHLLVEELNPIAPVTIPEGNILQGTATALAVEPNTVLTLGREKSRGTGQVGFWNFTGNTIAAHRCYIPKSVLDEAGGEIKGFGFYFGDETATGLEASTMDNVQSTGIYDLQGRRVTAPTKGIYIVNGKKVYVK